VDTRPASPASRERPATEPKQTRARGPSAETGARLERLRRVLDERGLTGALILSPPNVGYLAPDLAVTGSRALVVTADRVQATEPGRAGVAQMLEDVGCAAGELGSDLLGETGVRSGAHDLSGVLAGMRRVKDDAEVAAIAAAAACVDRGLEAARGALRVGVDDAALVETARRAILESTSSPVEFAFNIGVGELGVDPDATSSGAVVAQGDTVFLDLYPRIGAYFADATRTFSAGEPPRRVAEIVAALWAALDAAASLLRPGVRAADVDRRCRAELEARGVPAGYPHHTGHGVGLEQQERPWLVPGSPEIIVAGDVVALEPGVYAEAMGARVEELYVVREDGPERISHASRSLRAEGGSGD
jgi:Xaa-Pro aminopeptidase